MKKFLVLLLAATTAAFGAELSLFREELGLDRNLGTVFADLDLSSAGDNVADCYDREVNGRSLNLFNASLNLESIASFYYVSCETFLFNFNIFN